MPLERIQPAGFGPQPGPWAAAVRSGNYLFISGQVAIDVDGEVKAIGDPRGQAIKIHENLARILESVGATFADVIKVTIYIVDVAHRPAIQEVRYQYFGDTLPASTMVVVAGLVRPEFLLELEAVAEIPGA